MSIPFEPQLELAGERTCGAAALVMVYRSLGVAADHRAVWEAIAQCDRHGSRDARTSRLAADARRRGLEACCLEIARPWTALGTLQRAGLRIILNLRVRRESTLGHFCVLTAWSSDAARVHDPALGADLRAERDDLLRRWRGGGSECEVTGGVLVAVSAPRDEALRCACCGEPVPAEIACPRCGTPVALRPAEALGCAAAACTARLWRRVFCTSCDYGVEAG